MAEQDKTNITPFGIAPASKFKGVYTQPSQFSTPQVKPVQYKQTTGVAPAQQFDYFAQFNQPSTPAPATPTSYDITGDATGSITLPSGVGSGFTPDVRQYRNEAGNVLFIPFVNNKPLYPIPDGYLPVEEQEAKQKEEQQTQTTTQERTEDLFVSDSSGGDGSGDGDGDEGGYSASDDPGSYGLGVLGNAGLTGFAPGLTSALGLNPALSEDAAAMLGVAGALGVPGTGIIGGIGATVNQADVAMALGEVYGIEVDHLDALSIGFRGMENTQKGKEIMDAIIDNPAPMIGRQMDAAVTSGQISQEDADALSAAGIAFDNAKGFVDNMGMTYGEVAAQVEAEKDVSLDAFGGTGAPVGGGPSGSDVGGTPGGFGEEGGYADFGGMEGDEGPDDGDSDSGGGGGDGGGDGGGAKIVCTAINLKYGMPMHTNKIWLAFNKKAKMDGAWELGYHKLFYPLVKRMDKSKTVHDFLVWFARTRTYGVKKAMKGNYFTIRTLFLKPFIGSLVYVVGKLIQLGILKKQEVDVASLFKEKIIKHDKHS